MSSSSVWCTLPLVFVALMVCARTHAHSSEVPQHLSRVDAAQHYTHTTDEDTRPPQQRQHRPLTGKITAQLDPWGNNAIRIRLSQPGGTITEPIVGALLPDPPSPRSDIKTTRDGTNSLTHGNLQVSVSAKGIVSAKRVSDRKTLISMKSLSFGQATPFAANKSVSAVVTFARSTDDKYIYGLGEHKDNKLERGQNGGYKKRFADSLFYPDSQGGDVSIPWYSSSAGYGFIWNLPSFGSVDITDDEITWVSNATMGVDFWITTTGSPPEKNTTMYGELLNNYVDAVGHATPMPFWTTGFIQCKDRYRNQSQVLDVARGYVERGLPISMIVIDWFHWTEMGDMGLNPECWPDPKQMVDELRGMGIELMITFWPFMGLPYSNGTAVSRHWDEFNSNGYLATSTKTGKADSFWRYNTPTGNALIDSTNPAAMKAVTDHWYEGYGQYGVRAVWMDEAEPDHSSYISGGQWNVDLYFYLHAGSDGEVLPAWVHYWAQGFADKFREIGDDFFILSRNAWAGTWSNGAALWSGDIGSHWSDLATAVYAGQQASVSGIPLWTTDIGGYGGGNPDTDYFQQLIVRWFQFGAFSPLFRLHGHRGGKSAPPANQCGPTNGDNEVWNLAPKQDHYDAIVAVMHLREDLRNYVKRLNDVSVATGAPMMRPMYYSFPDDPVCSSNEAEAQFMLGDDWLISPVTAANVTSWPAYLPAVEGAEWVYWWNQTVIPAPGWINISTASLSDFPLFFRRPL